MVIDKPNGSKEIIFEEAEDSIRGKSSVKSLDEIEALEKTIWTNLYAIIRLAFIIFCIYSIMKPTIEIISMEVLSMQDNHKFDYIIMAIGALGVFIKFLFDFPIILILILTPKKVRTCKCNVWKLTTEIESLDDIIYSSDNSKSGRIKKKIATSIKNSGINEDELENSRYMVNVYTDTQYSTKSVEISHDIYISILQNPEIDLLLYQFTKRKHKNYSIGIKKKK